MTSLALVVCPLRFERRALQRAGLGRCCTLACSGPGADAIGRWASGQSPPGAVILCGLAGSLDSRFAVGTAHSVSSVLVDDGTRLTPSMSAPDGPVVSCPGGTLTSPEAKRKWAAHRGSDLVDQESAAFARVADENRWRWAIVRGVSDGPDTTLPADIDTWVDAAGRTRLGRVARTVLCGRVNPGKLMRLRADGTEAMEAAAAVIERMLE